ncbi:MAG: LamG domain-containing protein, partial [Phycisphaerales bacterium]
MKRTLTSVIVAAVLMTWGAGGAWAAPELSFVGSTPPDGGTVMGSSVEIEVSITESALAGVTFNWDGTDYVLYDNSLVMMFNFDNVLPGETSTYFVDLSTHDNDGAGLFFEGDEIVSGKSAEYGNAVDFDGIDDYIRIEDSPELNVITFTIEFWFNAHNPTGKTQSLVARGEDLGFDIAQWVVELDDPQNPDTVQLWIEEGDDTDWHYGLNTRPMPDTWYHYAVTRSSNGTVKVYLNGVKENEWTNQADPGIVPAPITIGARTNMSQADPQDYFDGIIDEVRTWDIALSEGQVAEHYMSNLRKYGPDSWTLYVDQSNLASGDYTYQVSATSASLETGTAGPRTVTMDAPPIEAVIIKGPYLQQV